MAVSALLQGRFLLSRSARSLAALRRGVALVCAFCVVPIAAGCNQNLDLSAVQTMAAQTAASKDTFDAVSADFYDSCLRGMKYLNSFDVSTCAKQQEASKLWQGANSILLSYVASLGALATDKQTDYGLTNLATAVAGIQGVKFTSAQQTAVVNAGKGLVSGVFASRRRDDLAAVMKSAERPDPAHDCPDGCLIDLVKQLTAIAQEDYDATILTAEDGRIQLFYTNNISLAEARLPAADAKGELGALGAVGRLIAIGYYADEATARQSVATKRAAVKQYVAALNKIVTAHHDIVNAIQNNHPDQLVGIAKEFVATYSAQLGAINKAFK